MPHRIGLGNDRHRLKPGEGIVLGGVRIPCNLGCVAHSDGDVLLHAITDALLGALGAGDIGELFPDTAEENRGRDSTDFILAAIDRMRKADYTLGNLDVTIMLEGKKLSPHKENIRQSLAKLFDCDAARVNIKAKTGEKVGCVGRGEAIEVWAVLLLIQAGKKAEA
jgi:2-C-methyl-D-erythritol 2,4-cyclodiphosphate synthase